MELVHASYQDFFDTIIRIGLYPGGLKGNKHHAQVFFSMVDFCNYNESTYWPEELPFQRSPQRALFPPFER